MKKLQIYTPLIKKLSKKNKNQALKILFQEKDLVYKYHKQKKVNVQHIEKEFIDFRKKIELILKNNNIR